MQNGTPIIIAKTANGFVVYEPAISNLPKTLDDILVASKIGGHYDSDGLISIIRNHFTEPLPAEDE